MIMRPIAPLLCLALLALPPAFAQQGGGRSITVEMVEVQTSEIESSVRALRAALDGSGPAPKGRVLGAPFAYYQDLESHDAPAEAARLGIPVLVLHGKRDYQVTLEDVARWRDELAGAPGACLVLYDDLDHLFRAGEGPSGPDDYLTRAPVASEVLDDIAAWVHDRRCP